LKKKGSHIYTGVFPIRGTNLGAFYIDQHILVLYMNHHTIKKRDNCSWLFKNN